MFGRLPDYREHYGVWLNRNREFHRTTAAVMNGVAYALGLATPDWETFESVSSSVEEAVLKKKQHEAMRGMISDG